MIDSLDAGGMERVLLTLVEQQIKQSFVVRILCLFRSGVLADEARGLGAEVIVVSKKNGLDAGAFYRVWRNFREFKPDVIHTHNAVSHYHASAAAVIVGRRIDVNTRHDMGSHNENVKLNFLYRLACWNTRWTVAVCDAAKNAFIDRKLMRAGKTASIRNGIDLGRQSNVSAVKLNDFIGGDQVRSGRIVCLSVGRLETIKGLELLIQAFDMATKDNAKVFLVIVGVGSLEAHLKEISSRLLSAPRIVFLGFRKDTAAIMKASDIFLQSSISEGYSLALVEASAAGLPIIATDVGGNREIVVEDESGFLIPNRDPHQFARAIQQLIGNELLRANFSSAAINWAAKYGSASFMEERYRLLYASAADA